MATTPAAVPAAPPDDAAVLEALLAHAPVGFAFLDLELRYVRINPRLAEMNGIPAAAHLGRHVSQIVPSLAPKVEVVAREILESGQAVENVEFSGQTPATRGETGYWRESWYPVRDAANAIIGFGVVIEDITERRNREAHARLLAELSDEFAALHSADEILVAVGRRLGAALSISTCSFSDVDDPRDEFRVAYAWREGETVRREGSLRISRYLNDELRRTYRARRTVVVRDTGADSRTPSEAYAEVGVGSFVGVPFHDDGQWKYMLAITTPKARDWREDEIAFFEEIANRVFPRIERARAEAALRASEERLRKALSIDTVGVLFFRLDGRMLDANPAFERMVGYSVDELRDHVHWRELTPPEHWERTERTAENLAARGETPPYEKQFIRKDGSRFWGLFAPTRLSGSGTQSLCVEFIIDITRQKEQEQALLEGDRRKDQFLAILAHELRNPLAPIRTGLELLGRMPAAGAGSGAEVLAMMDRQLRHMVRLIDELLDVSRISRGKIELRRENILLADAVRQGIEASRPHIEARKHELIVSLPDEPLRVHADLTRMSQVVANLLNNAAKFTPPGGRIAVELSRAADDAVLTVRDTGQGLSRDMLSQVFDMFTQVERVGTSDGGLGIGLSIVKGLVDLHGGSVTAKSAGIGRGSEFVVRLPLQEKPASNAQPDTGSQPSLEARRVLVVDDNVDAANSMAQLLRLAGSDTRVAYDGEAAIAAHADYKPDLILLDIGLPGMNGYDVCRTIRSAKGGHAPVIVALSGWGQQQDRHQSDLAGFDAHLVKPVDFARLASVVSRAARR